MSELSQGELATGPQELITECQERFRFAQEANSSNVKEFEFDKRFVAGDQWEPTIRDERFSDRRPCLTVNITDAICRRVANACRENRPRIVCHPVGSGASIQTAKVFDGLIRHIEYASNASYAYDTSVENAIHGGWGWLGIDAEYVSDESFDQELKIVTWANPLMIYADPNSRLPDASDMEWLIETQLMKRTEYRERFGKIDVEGWKFVGGGDNVPDWSNKEEIRIAKYWRVERDKDQLLKLSNGSSILRSRIKDTLLDKAGLSIIERRDVFRRQVRCYLVTAFRVLDTRVWPGKFIPRVPVYGRRQDLNGKTELRGMVRDLRDIARMYNYAQTAKTEQYALLPKAPWMGAEGFMDGHENAWRDANRKPIVALEYKPVRLEDGSFAPPPERQAPPQPNAGFAEWGDSTRSDFLHVAGMSHDPDMDRKGEVVSGIALKRRQGLADISNYDFYDNLTRSLRQVGRILVDLIPHYYDTQRIIRCIQEDGTPKIETINQPVLDPMTQAVMKVENDLTVGDYEVIVDTGPSYQTKREESAEMLVELLGTPLGEMVAQAAGDKVVRAMDFADADGVADRIMAMIPAAQMEGMKDLPPKAQALVAGMQAQLKQMQQHNLALELELHTKKGIEQMKQGGETQRVQMKEDGAMQREQLKVGAQTHDTHVDAVTRHNVAELQIAGQIITKGMEHGHEAAMGARELAHEERLSDKEMGLDLFEGERGRQHEASEASKDRSYESTEAQRGREHESAEAREARKHESSEAQHQRGHESRESSKDRGHQSKEAQHQRGHEARQGSAERNSKKP